MPSEEEFYGVAVKQELSYDAFFYDQWERRYGEPSSSNEWIWNYFYQNYKP